MLPSWTCFNRIPYTSHNTSICKSRILKSYNSIKSFYWISDCIEDYFIRQELLSCLEKFPNYYSFNVLHNFENTSSYCHIFMTQNQTPNKCSTWQLWSWQFATYSPSFYFLSFHQTTAHGTVIDVLHTLERTSCIELEGKTKTTNISFKTTLKKTSWQSKSPFKVFP